MSADVKAAEKADPSNAGRPRAVRRRRHTVAEDVVEPGGVVATIEAMKMEANITSPVSGTVERLAIAGHQQVEGGDLILVVTPPDAGGPADLGRRGVESPGAQPRRCRAARTVDGPHPVKKWLGAPHHDRRRTPWDSTTRSRT